MNTAIWRFPAAGRVPAHEEWLIAQARRPARGTRLGFYDGLAGVAYVLWRLGHGDAALDAVDVCLSDRWERLGCDLYGGLPGLSLALLCLGDAMGEPALLDAGQRAAEIVAERTAPRGGGTSRDTAGTGQGTAATGREAAGLLHGAAGRALLFIRLYERTADAGYLDAAATALAADLNRCVTDGKGSLQVDEGWRMLPYLKGGSAGIGMVVDHFLAHRDIPAFAEPAAAISAAAHASYYAQPGLFNGRAGLLLYLANRAGAGGEATQAGADGEATQAGAGGEATRAGAGGEAKHIAAHVRRLAWHALPYAGGLAFPGDMLLRLSMDLATGTAGALLALAAALSPDGAALPFLGRPGVPAGGHGLPATPRASASLPGRPSPVQGAEEQRVQVRR